MKARIFRPAKNAMQSGQAKSRSWILQYEPADARSIEPLMGYTSSTDMNQQVKLSFATKEDAIAYAERNAIEFELREPQERKRRIMAYSDNFATNRVEGNWTH